MSDELFVCIIYFLLSVLMIMITFILYKVGMWFMAIVTAIIALLIMIEMVTFL